MSPDVRPGGSQATRRPSLASLSLASWQAGRRGNKLAEAKQRSQTENGTKFPSRSATTERPLLSSNFEQECNCGPRRAPLIDVQCKRRRADNSRRAETLETTSELQQWPHSAEKKHKGRGETGASHKSCGLFLSISWARRAAKQWHELLFWAQFCAWAFFWAQESGSNGTLSANLGGNIPLGSSWLGAPLLCSVWSLASCGQAARERRQSLVGHLGGSSKVGPLDERRSHAMDAQRSSS